MHMLKSVGDKMPPCGIHILIGVMLMFFSSECGVCFSAFDVIFEEFENGVWDVCLV